MQVRGLCYVLGLALCLGLVGCSNQPKKQGHYGKKDHAAQTQGQGEGSSFEGSEEQRDLLAKRKIYFDYDRADIREYDMPLLAAHAEYLKQNQNRRIRLEGHTDENGSREYNIALGEKRACAVADILASHGVSRHQIVIVSFGKQKPDSNGHTEESHALNRRAVIVYEEI